MMVETKPNKQKPNKPIKTKAQNFVCEQKQTIEQKQIIKAADNLTKTETQEDAPL